MARAETLPHPPHHHPALRWKPAIWAGIIAGVAFLVLEMMLMMFKGMSPWGPPHMMAAMVLGEGVLPPPGTMAPFDFGIVMVAMMVHLGLSLIYAIGFAFVLERMNTRNAVIAGAAFGFALYLLNFFVFTSLFPWFAMARGVDSAIAHIFYGVVLAYAYKALTRRAKVRAK
jgi:hypothetical protein